MMIGDSYSYCQKFVFYLDLTKQELFMCFVYFSNVN